MKLVYSLFKSYYSVTRHSYYEDKNCFYLHINWDKYIKSKQYPLNFLLCLPKKLFDTEEWKIYKVLSNQFYWDTSSYEEREAVFESNIKKCYERYSAEQMNDFVQCINFLLCLPKK